MNFKNIIILSSLFSMTAYGATKEQVLDFLAPIKGVHVMTGTGCGNVRVEASEPGAYFYIKIASDSFSLGTGHGIKIANNTLSFLWEEADSYWHHLSDWNKQEMIIRKDSDGNLASVTYRSGWGKPFYKNKVKLFNCTAL